MRSLNEAERELRDRCDENGMLYPAYEDYCFANIPSSIMASFGGDADTKLPANVYPDDFHTWERVVVFLVDGFGLNQWKRFSDHPLLNAFHEAGRVTPLTSIYPSETAAAMTSFHTDALPTEHGAIGWNAYDPEWDSAFKVFGPEVKAGASLNDDQRSNAVAADPIYPALRELGVDCRHIVSMDSTYDGAELYSYEKDNPSEAGRKVLEADRDAEDRAYLFCYLPQLDGTAHSKGNHSVEYDRAAYYVLDVIEQVIDQLNADDDTLVAFAADHGQIDKDGGFDLEECDWVMNNLERHSDGTPVKYAGSPRNVHLHLQDGARNEVASRIRDEFGAQVFTREDVLESGLFGDGEPSDVFRRRVGDLVVTHREEAIWYGSESDEFDLVGMHGGLHPDEMLVPFATAPLDELNQPSATHD